MNLFILINNRFAWQEAEINTKGLSLPLLLENFLKRCFKINAKVETRVRAGRAAHLHPTRSSNRNSHSMWRVNIKKSGLFYWLSRKLFGFGNATRKSRIKLEFFTTPLPGCWGLYWLYCKSCQGEMFLREDRIKEIFSFIYLYVYINHDWVIPRSQGWL